MSFLRDLGNALPVRMNVDVERKTIVQYQKLNLIDLEVCHPKMVIREQAFFRTDKVDIYHAWADGYIVHTPG